MANLPHLRLYRVGTAAALVVAPLLFLIDNLIHPEELSRGNELEQVRLIADAYTRWQAAHGIGFLAILAFAPAVLGLLRELSRLDSVVAGPLVAGIDPLVDRAAAFLAAEMDAGTIRRADPRLSANRRAPRQSSALSPGQARYDRRSFRLPGGRYGSGRTPSRVRPRECPALRRRR